jgi:hypothetical protein
VKKNTDKRVAKSETAICPHCGEDFEVKENGRYICPGCENYVDVDDWFHVPAVLQPDDDSCGWATTLWLLRSFGALDVTPAQLRRELNTDARRGVRALWNGSLLREWAEQLSGRDLEAGRGTLPLAIYGVLSRRGIVLKNPIRAESPREFTGYLNDTFRAGGRAAILLWRGFKLWHWMGAMREKGRIRIMDPATGTYQPFVRGIRRYETATAHPHFLVFGFVRD